MDSNGEQGMNIVIFEGGLAGGLSSLIIFKEIMARICAVTGGARRIHQLCKVMAGTGTGALIACMLGLLGMDVDQAIAAYSKLIKVVFSDKKMISMSGSGTFKASRLEKELKKIVKDRTGDENTRMVNPQQDEADCKIMMFTMSEHNLNASTPRIFRSYRVSKNETPNCPIWQVLRASMAHPELFKSIRIGDAPSTSESLIGGDVACSNPTAHVLTEVSTLYPEGYISSIICIGTGHTRTIVIPKANPLNRIMPTNVLIAMKNIATDCERVAQEMAERFQHMPNVYFRLSVDQGLQNARLDQWQNHVESIAHTRAYTQQPGTTKLLDQAVKAIVGKIKTLRVTSADGKARRLSVHQAVGIKRCPAPSPAFTGREHQVSRVVKCLMGPIDERRVCVVHGLGGSGKTQIALKAVERTKEKWSDIIYVDATTRETIIASLKGFALGKMLGETYEHALRWLELTRRHWLLVFDNADDPDLRISDFIPGGSCGSVLITTRLRTLVTLGQPQGPESECAVSGMDAEEGLELLLKTVRIQDQTLPSEELESATQLVRNLGCLALAIIHAGAYIWYFKSSFTGYRERYQEHTQSALEQSGKLTGSTEEYEKTMHTTWAMSYQRLQPRTQQLLGLMAYLHHGGITEDIFRRAASNRNRTPAIPPNDEQAAIHTYVKNYLELFLDTQGQWDSTKFSATIDELLVYSLISFDRINKAYTLHVLVQDWTCATISESNTAAVSHTSRLLALSIDESAEMESRIHQIQLSLHMYKLENLTKIDEDDAYWFALAYDKNAQWREAEKLEARVVDARKRALGEWHPDTLTSMNNLALIYQSQARWTEAETLHTRVLETRKQTFGERHPDTLASMVALGLVYQSQGQWDKAEDLQMQALNARKQVLGKLHLDTLASMNKLATVYESQRRWDEAASLHAQVLEASKQVLGERHPETLVSMRQLAYTYESRCLWDEAGALQLQVLKARKQVLGEWHPDTLTTLNDLAIISTIIYKLQGRQDEAATLRKEVLEVSKQVLGERHRDTLSSRDNLPLTYQPQDRRGEAEIPHMQPPKATKQTLVESYLNARNSTRTSGKPLLDGGHIGAACRPQLLAIKTRGQFLLLLAQFMIWVIVSSRL
ncbi:hypothetical protein FRC12_007206 [Ceratobasidium sp. 428]|nr:hypothetical protein FRC12_007206 [Ceratobasidium sp. 428]